MSFWWLGLGVILVGFIGAAAWLVRHGEAPTTSHAQQALAERCAHGEISADEYEQQRREAIGKG
jgi:uncharacterized membrane protein